MCRGVCERLSVSMCMFVSVCVSVFFSIFVSVCVYVCLWVCAPCPFTCVRGGAPTWPSPSYRRCVFVDVLGSKLCACVDLGVYFVCVAGGIGRLLGSAIFLRRKVCTIDASLREIKSFAT